jgi:hypothetical protein
VTVRCPRQMRGAGGVGGLGVRQWLIKHRRIGPVIRHWSAPLIPCYAPPASGESERWTPTTNR